MPSLVDTKKALAARAYNAGPSWYYQPAYRFIVADIDLRAGAWLDIGTGPGSVCVYAAAGNPQLDVVGIDTSEAMLKVADENRGGRLNITLRKMDAETIVYPARTFDVVTAMQVAHHWKNTPAILAEIHRVLVDGGRFYLYEANPEGEIPDGWLRRRGGVWPPDAVFRARWAKYGMDQAGWDALKAVVAQSPFGGDFADEHHGFYRRLVCTR